MVTLCKHDALRLFDVAIEVQSRIKTMNETTQSTSSDEMQIRPKKPSPRIHTPYPWDEVTKVTESSTSKTRPKLSKSLFKFADRTESSEERQDQALSYENRTILNVRKHHVGAVRVLSQVPEKLKPFLSGVPTEHLPFEYWHDDPEFESSGLSVVCIKAVSNATSERFNSKAKHQLLIGKNFGQHTLQAKLFLRSVKAIFKEFFKTLVKNNCLDAYKAARRYVKSTSDHNKTTTFFDWND